MHFLTLHTVAGNEIRINMDLIESYGTITAESYDSATDYTGKTYLVQTGMSVTDEPYMVTETPDQIDQMLEWMH